MNYTLTDLIQKLIDIEKAALKIYKIIKEMHENEFKAIGVIAKVIEKEEEKHIEYYERLKS